MLANVGQKTMLSQFARSLFRRMPRAKRVLLRAHQAIFGERDEWRRQAHFWKYYSDLYEWRWRSVAGELWGEPIGPPPPIRFLPTEMRDAFTMDGRIPLGEQWGDGTQPQNHPLIYTDAEIDNCIARIKRGETSIYLDTDRLLWLHSGDTRSWENRSLSWDRSPHGMRPRVSVSARDQRRLSTIRSFPKAREYRR